MKKKKNSPKVQQQQLCLVIRYQAVLVFYVNNDVYYVVFHVNITSKIVRECFVLFIFSIVIFIKLLSFVF